MGTSKGTILICLMVLLGCFRHPPHENESQDDQQSLFLSLADSYENQGAYQFCRFYLDVAHAYSPLDPDIRGKKKQFFTKMRKKAKALIHQGIVYIKHSNHLAAQNCFVEALRFDPHNPDALNYLTSLENKQTEITWVVRKGDTPEKIVQSIYGTVDLMPIVTFLYSKALKPGMLLALPVLPKGFQHQFRQSLINKDQRLTKEHSFETEIKSQQSLIRQDKPLSNKKEADVKSSVQSPQTVKKKVTNLSHTKIDLKKAELHYHLGLQYFLEENLKKAIKEWQLALVCNPNHRKSVEGIQKVKMILKGLDKNR